MAGVRAGSPHRCVPAVLAALVVVASACGTPGPVDSPAGEPGEAGAPGTAEPAPGVTQPQPHRGDGGGDAAGACRDAPGGPGEYRYASRPGADANLTSLDVYLPAGCGPAPGVVWVHGGGWRRGDKAGGSVPALAAFANDLGAALVSVNYRLTGPGTGVRWPDHGNDVAAALAWMDANGPDVGVDPDRLALIGHSAGGHLVAVAATDPALLATNGADPAAPRCVVVLDSAAMVLDAGDPLHAATFGTDAVVLAGASPQVLVERNGAPPAEFLVVAQGRPARVAAQRSFTAAITAAGGTAAFLDANPLDHAGVAAAVGRDDDPVVTPAVRDLLVRCLTP